MNTKNHSVTSNQTFQLTLEFQIFLSIKQSQVWSDQLTKNYSKKTLILTSVTIKQILSIQASPRMIY